MFVCANCRWRVTRSRAMIGVLAVLGVLLNAALIVRHHAIMVQTALASTTQAVQSANDAGALDVGIPGMAALAADLQVLCHSAVADEKAGDGKSGNGMSTCPLCMGLSHTAAVLTPADAAGLLLPKRGIRFALPRRDDCVEVQRRIRPPGRAPPLTA